MVGALYSPFIGEIFLALSATALKNKKYSSQNNKLFELFGLAPKSCLSPCKQDGRRITTFFEP